MTARPPAPPLTPTEQARADAFEAADYPAEVALELLIAEARALFEPPIRAVAEWLTRHLPGAAS